MNDTLLFEEETGKIIRSAIDIYNNVGPGFNEPIYQEMLWMDLNEIGISSEMEYHLPIYYQGKKLTHFQKADIVADEKIIIEIKAVSKLISEHRHQLLRYLKMSGMQVGLLINFGHSRTLEWERLVYTDSKYLDKGNIPK